MVTVNSGKEQIVNDRAKGRFEIITAVHDKHGKIIGSFNFVFLFPANTDVNGKDFLIEAHTIIRNVERQLDSVRTLYKPSSV
jgi:hypothetical protein